jgi:hypothetical protein
MKKVDANKVWRRQSKAEKLELKGFSNPPSSKPPNEREISDKSKLEETKVSRKPQYHAITLPSNHETTTPRYHDTIIEIIRKAVKDFGKEAATHRFTIDEKKAIANIIFHFKVKDIKTSENEITRIAVNFIVQEHEVNGRKSILERTLKALKE